MYNLIPRPRKMAIKNSLEFTFTPLTKVTYVGLDNDLIKTLTHSLTIISKKTRIFFQEDSEYSQKTIFSLTKLYVVQNGKLKNEEYKVFIKEKQVIKIEISSLHSFLRAMATLMQIYLQDQMFRELEIHDWPTNEWRSNMIVVQEASWTLLDYENHIWHLFLFKINRFMLNGSSRFEITAIKTINEIAGLVNFTGLKADKLSFTMNEAKYIANYGKALGLIVYPGYNTPGHSNAVVKSHPEMLRCQIRSSDLQAMHNADQEIVGQNWTEDIPVCISKESTLAFMKKVYDELIDAFESPYIHIGGDECPVVWWTKCVLCQKKMQAMQLNDVYELQAWYMSSLINYLGKKGVKAIVWDDILEHSKFSHKNLIVEMWRDWYFSDNPRITYGEPATPKLKKRGKKLLEYLHNNKVPVIASWNNKAYMDWNNSARDVREGGHGDWILNLEGAYQYKTNIFWANVKQPTILGGTSLQWDPLKVTHFNRKLYPRILANAEVLWGTNESYPNFKKRAKRLCKRLLEKLNINYFGGDLDL